jgi:hypothetical protein
MRSRRTMSPMTIVVVRDEPAGSSADAASFFVAGFAAAVAVSAVAGAAVAGAGADVVGASAVAAVAALAAVVAVDVVAAVCCERAVDVTRRARRRAGIAERRFMTGETIGRTRTRQAAMGRA